MAANLDLPLTRTSSLNLTKDLPLTRTSSLNLTKVLPQQILEDIAGNIYPIKGKGLFNSSSLLQSAISNSSIYYHYHHDVTDYIFNLEWEWGYMYSSGGRGGDPWDSWNEKEIMFKEVTVTAKDGQSIDENDLETVVLLLPGDTESDKIISGYYDEDSGEYWLTLRDLITMITDAYEHRYYAVGKMTITSVSYDWDEDEIFFK